MSGHQVGIGLKVDFESSHAWLQRGERADHFFSLVTSVVPHLAWVTDAAAALWQEIIKKLLLVRRWCGAGWLAAETSANDTNSLSN